MSYLEQFLEIATKTENLTAQGEACCALGVIYNKRGDYKKAVEHFEKNFEIARSVVSSGAGDSSLVDASRVYLGMARGNALVGKVRTTMARPVSVLVSLTNSFPCSRSAVLHEDRPGHQGLAQLEDQEGAPRVVALLWRTVL